MSTQKSNQPGAPAHKHVTFTPASEVSGHGNHDADNSASSAYNEADRSGSQNQKSARSKASDNNKQGQQSWLDQQQWLKNIDVQQIKDLGSKAVDQVNKLTPTQKAVGGALLVGGLSWLALRSKSSSSKGETYRSYRGSSDNNSSSSSSKWNSSSDSVYRGATRSYGEDDYASDL